MSCRFDKIIYVCGIHLSEIASSHQVSAQSLHRKTRKVNTQHQAETPNLGQNSLERLLTRNSLHPDQSTCYKKPENIQRLYTPRTCERYYGTENVGSRRDYIRKQKIPARLLVYRTGNRA